MSAYSRNDKTKAKSPKMNIFETPTSVQTSIQLGANIIIESSNDDQAAAAATHFPKVAANKQASSATSNVNYNSTRTKTPLQMKVVPKPVPKANVIPSTSMTAPLFPVPVRSTNVVKMGQSQFQYNPNQAKPHISVANPTVPMPSKVPPVNIEVVPMSVEGPPESAEMPPESDEVLLASDEKAPDAVDLQLEHPEETKIEEEDYDNLSQVVRDYQSKKSKKVRFNLNIEEISTGQKSIQVETLFKEKVQKHVDKKPVAEKPSDEELIDSIASIPPVLASEKPPRMEPAHIDDRVNIEQVDANRYIIYVDDDDDDVEIVIKRRKR